ADLHELDQAVAADIDRLSVVEPNHRRRVRRRKNTVLQRDRKRLVARVPAQRARPAVSDRAARLDGTDDLAGRIVAAKRVKTQKAEDGHERERRQHQETQIPPVDPVRVYRRGPTHICNYRTKEDFSLAVRPIAPPSASRKSTATWSQVRPSATRRAARPM